MDRVIIIGGGPAGSATGAYLSKAGIPNLILESDNHPRPHVGESLVMSCVAAFDDIDFLDIMEQADFVHKYGASWHEVKGREAAIRFADFPLKGVHQEYTYHVDRAKFDNLLLKHAQTLGSEVYQGVRVTKVNFEDDQAVGVEAEIGGERISLNANIVVDASGRATVLGNQLRLKNNDPIFDQYAVHAWFENVERGQSETADYIHIYFLPVQRGWAWQIPITEEVTSIGVVAERDELRKFKGDPAGFFEEYVQSNLALAEAMKPAVRINDYKTEGDYSYSMGQFAGNGWLLVGDAARFVDPIFSSGVSIALASAKFAAEEIKRARERDDYSRGTLIAYEEKVRSGVEIWYEFIRLYYKLLPLFTHFIRSDKHKLEVLRLLQGDVYDRSSVPVLDAMRSYIDTVEKNDSHILKGQLAAIPIDDIPLPD